MLGVGVIFREHVDCVFALLSLLCPTTTLEWSGHDKIQQTDSAFFSLLAVILCVQRTHTRRSILVAKYSCEKKNEMN